jgi:hypothetical protein
MFNAMRTPNGFQPLRLAFTTFLLGACLALGACVAVDEEVEPTQAEVKPELREPPAPRPWTTDFREPGLLIANKVYIEGPKGLLDHVATRTVDEFHSYEAKTLPEGFRQTFRVLRPEAGVELRTYLDALEVVIFNELILIEKPGKIDVTVRGQGDAYWRDPVSGEEKRSFEISLKGAVNHPK